MMKAPRSEALPRRRFDVAEVVRMAEAGVFQDEERLELVDGELIPMAIPGSRHAAEVARLGAMLHHRVASSVLVWTQNPLHLDDRNLFLPDLALLRARSDFYGRGYPRGSDAVLVVEIAEATLSRDRRVKLPRYAAAGVQHV